MSAPLDADPATRTLSDGRPVRWIPSPNHDARAAGRPDMIVLHYTDMTSAEAAVARLCDPAARVSAHYLIGADGDVVQMVDEQRRAWHAGLSAWGPSAPPPHDINSRAIGIELDSPGHRPAAPTFPDPQVDALLVLLADLRARWPVPPWNVVAHSDIAPSRKIDPGEAFPWARLAAAGHVIATPEVPRVTDVLLDDGDRERLLAALAASLYVVDPATDPAVLIDAFHRRHLPDLLGGPPTARSLALAEALAEIVRVTMAAYAVRHGGPAS